MPVLCGSAFKNKGVQPLLDAVVDFLPSPLDVPPTKGVKPNSDEVVERRSADDEPFSALAFKIMTDPFVGTLGFVRVYSGMVESGSYVLNTVKGTRERIGRILEMHANTREEVKEARAGDIVALVGLKSATTGDTLSDPSRPVVLERMEFPDPVIEVAVEPKTKADQEKLSIALGKLAAEDPSFRVGHGCRIRPDRDQGHGRAASRDHRRPAQARVQGRRQCRRAAGRLSRDRRAHQRYRLHPQEADRRRGPVRADQAAAGAGRARLGPGVHEQDRRRLRAARVHSRRREGHRRGGPDRRAGGLSDGRPGDLPGRWRLSRGRQLGHGVRDRGARRVPRGSRRRPGRSCSSR